MPTDTQNGELPSFSELCLSARSMEKRLVAVKPGKSGEALDLSDSSAIFPREFESYTFAYALSEAQKVERKLFASGYQAALNAPAGEARQRRAKGMDERQIESELSKFEASDKPALAPAKAAEPRRPGGISVGPIRLPFGRKAAEAAAGQEEPQVAGQPEEIPPRKPTGMPAEIEFAAEAELSARRRLEKGVSSEPPEAPEDEEAKGIEEKELEFGEALAKQPGSEETGEGEERELEAGKELKKARPGPEEEIPVPDEFEIPSPQEGGEEEEGEKEELPLPLKKPASQGPAPSEDEPPLPPQKPSASGEEPPIQLPKPGKKELPSAPAPSALSPRLREIIEARLKKEEEDRAAQEEGEADETPSPGQEAEGQQEQPAEEIIMSARERMLKRRGKSQPRTEEAQEEAPGISQEYGEPEAGPETGKEEGEPQEQEELPSEPEIEKEEPAAEPEAEKEKAPAKGRRKTQEAEAPEVPLAAGPGGLLIKPIFAGEEEGEEKSASQTKKAAQAEAPIEEERLRRIQRVLGQLSPDKYKAGAIPKRTAAKEPAGEAEAEQPEEEEEPPGKEKPKANTGAKAKQKTSKSQNAASKARQTAKGAKAAKGSARQGKGGGPASEQEQEPRGKIPAASSRQPIQPQPRARAREKASGQKAAQESAEEAPMLSARERLIRAIEERNKQNPEPLDEEAAEPAPPVQPGVRTRILPGGISVQQKGTMRTYVPPARQRLIPSIQAVKKGGEGEEPLPAQAARQQLRAPGKAMPTSGMVPRKLAAAPAAEEEEEQPPEEKPPARKAYPQPAGGALLPKRKPAQETEEASHGEEEAPSADSEETTPEAE
ncbi:Uncharacterised protein [uncultured archaeon]|nr:Uncharacterised protein [uncultured archaeon]